MIFCFVCREWYFVFMQHDIWVLCNMTLCFHSSDCRDGGSDCVSFDSMDDLLADDNLDAVGGLHKVAPVGCGRRAIGKSALEKQKFVKQGAANTSAVKAKAKVWPKAKKAVVRRKEKSGASKRTIRGSNVDFTEGLYF